FPMDEDGRTRFRQSFRGRFDGDPSRVTLYKDVSNGIAPPGIEYYLPLFHERTSTLAEYLPDGATVCLHGAIEEAAREFWQDTESRHALLQGNPLHPVLKPAELFLRGDELFGSLKAFARVDMDAPAPSTLAKEGDELLPPSRLTPHAPTAARLPVLTVERRT